MHRNDILTLTCVVLFVCSLGCNKKDEVTSKEEPKTLTVELGDGLDMKLVRIEQGEFVMGSTRDGESPPHKVTIGRPFYMGQTEVTNAQFRAFQPEYNSNDRRGGANLDYQVYIRSLKPELNNDEQPVVYVSWKEARAFTEWLSKKSGMKVRLPSEAEWEYACRAGSTTRYSWGDDTADAYHYANTGDPVTKQEFKVRDGLPNDDGFRATAPVGSFKPNAFGLFDMHGNVVEFVADPWHEDYEGAPTDGSVWQKDESKAAAASANNKRR